jgi:DNA polymerase III subunit alpha
MPSPRFVHLRFHSEYSITDGIVRIDPMIHAVLEGGGAAVGISDLMNVFGGLRFYTHALAAGLKPILGCDLKVINPSDLDTKTRGAFADLPLRADRCSRQATCRRASGKAAVEA